MKKNNIIQFFVFTVFLFCGTLNLYAQSSGSPWVRIEESKEQNLRIDLSTLRCSSEGDIYVWCLETHKTPIQIENIAQNIFKTKIQYMLNSKMMKYSILEIMYYDSTNTQLGDFIYRTKGENPALKYNYPIMEDSPIYSVLLKSLDYLRNKNAKKP